MATINGIDVEALTGGINAVKENPALGKRTFKATTKWLGGTKSQSTIRDFKVDADEPKELVGTDTAPNPVEIVLAALGSCLVTGYAANAAALGIEIENMWIELKGDLDLQGFFGLSDEVRPGYSDIRYTTHIKSPAPKEKLEELRKHVEKTSPCGDICANPIGAVSSELVFE